MPRMSVLSGSGRGAPAGRQAIALTAVRAAAGVGLVAAPALVPRLLGVDGATARRVGYLGRMVGVRDLALALGTLRALRRGEDATPWVLAQALSDTGDAVAVAAAVRRREVDRLPGAALTAGAALGAAAGIRAARLLRRGG